MRSRLEAGVTTRLKGPFGRRHHGSTVGKGLAAYVGTSTRQREKMGRLTVVVLLADGIGFGTSISKARSLDWMTSKGSTCAVEATARPG